MTIKMNQDLKYCIAMLPKVSRTFAPTIRMLPERLYGPVTIAYLLCRVADTIEDSSQLSVMHKKSLLHDYANIFNSNDNDNAVKLFMLRATSIPHENTETELIHNLQVILNVYEQFSPAVRITIATWVVKMAIGMRKYAQSTIATQPRFLTTMTELDEYTFYVAGTVGHLLTGLFSLYSRNITPGITDKLHKFSASFGKGLQLVNIIRDLPNDWRDGRSYLPDEILDKYQLTRQSIFAKENTERAVVLVQELVLTATTRLDQALDYVILLPKIETRIRLFCLLPLFWALRTLQKIQNNIRSLLAHENVKISRHVIRQEFYFALVNALSNRLIRYRYGKIREDIHCLSTRLRFE